MTSPGDTNRPRGVKLEIDPDFYATAQAGGLLVEQTLRSLGISKMLKTHLPQRSEQAAFTSSEFAYSAIAALLLGGDGLKLFEPLRQDAEARKMFGLKEVASDATTHRILCELAGLPQRAFAEVYAPAGHRLARLDMFGQAKPPAAQRRRLRAVRRAERAVALRCLKALRQRLIRLHGWTVVFGDGSDLAVEGRCFDAARLPRQGELIFRWMTLRVGPVLVDQDLLAGNADEGRTLPGMLRHEVAPGRERGMSLERMRRWFFQVAGYVVRGGRNLVVRLAGAALDRRRQAQLLEAYANARRL
jgi:hypothetical protein